MTDEELQEMIDEADSDGDGEINEEEFLREEDIAVLARHSAGSLHAAGRVGLWRIHGCCKTRLDTITALQSSRAHAAGPFSLRIPQSSHTASHPVPKHDRLRTQQICHWDRTVGDARKKPIQNSCQLGHTCCSSDAKLSSAARSQVRPPGGAVLLGL
jgi:hypothetical protein